MISGNIAGVFANNGVFARFMNQLAEEDKFSGVVLVTKNFEILFEKAYGMADKSRSISNNTNTKFNLGSVSKMFTAAAIMRLAEKGKLAVCDTIDKYINDFTHETARKITIERLLTHTSGVGDIFTPEYLANKDEVGSINGFMSYIVNQPLCFEPGERHQYSNGGFIVLGAIIEKVFDIGYYDYIKEYITKPLGMHDTGFFIKTGGVPQCAHGYTRWNKGMPPLSPDGLLMPEELPEVEDNLISLPLIGSPAGGAYSTARDMFRFSSALMSCTLLSKESTEQMITGKVTSPFGKYGYGFEDLLENGRRVVGHSGGAPGINALFRVFADDGYTVIILSNYDMGTFKPWEEVNRLIDISL